MLGIPWFSIRCCGFDHELRGICSWQTPFVLFLLLLFIFLLTLITTCHFMFRTFWVNVGLYRNPYDSHFWIHQSSSWTLTWCHPPQRLEETNNKAQKSSSNSSSSGDSLRLISGGARPPGWSNQLKPEFFLLPSPLALLHNPMRTRWNTTLSSAAMKCDEAE